MISSLPFFGGRGRFDLAKVHTFQGLYYSTVRGVKTTSVPKIHVKAKRLRSSPAVFPSVSSQGNELHAIRAARVCVDFRLGCTDFRLGCTEASPQLILLSPSQFQERGKVLWISMTQNPKPSLFATATSRWLKQQNPSRQIRARARERRNP